MTHSVGFAFSRALPAQRASPVMRGVLCALLLYVRHEAEMPFSAVVGVVSHGAGVSCGHPRNTFVAAVALAGTTPCADWLDWVVPDLECRTPRRNL